MAKTQSQSPGSAPPDLDRPTGDEACISLREDGRQLVISREDFPGENASDPGSEIEFGSDDDDSSSDSGGEPHQGGGKRGKVGGYSECARRRNRELLHAIDRSADGLFLTLTYQNHLPGPQEAKRDLDVWWKRLKRRFPGLSAVWKLEPQERGHPHFHLLVFGTRFIDAQWLSSIWHEVTAETAAQHEKAGVDVEGHVNLDSKIQAYMAKYMAETYDGWPDGGGEEWKEMGRWWGVLGRDSLPIASWADWRVHIAQPDAVQLINALLAEWDVDIPPGVVPPSLLVNCHGRPSDRLDRLLDRLD